MNFNLRSTATGPGGNPSTVIAPVATKVPGSSIQPLPLKKPVAVSPATVLGTHAPAPAPAPAPVGASGGLSGKDRASASELEIARSRWENERKLFETHLEQKNRQIEELERMIEEERNTAKEMTSNHSYEFFTKEVNHWKDKFQKADLELRNARESDFKNRMRCDELERERDDVQRLYQSVEPQIRELQMMCEHKEKEWEGKALEWKRQIAELEKKEGVSRTELQQRCDRLEAQKSELAQRVDALQHQVRQYEEKARAEEVRLREEEERRKKAREALTSTAPSQITFFKGKVVTNARDLILEEAAAKREAEERYRRMEEERVAKIRKEEEEERKRVEKEKMEKMRMEREAAIHRKQEEDAARERKKMEEEMERKRREKEEQDKKRKAEEEARAKKREDEQAVERQRREKEQRMLALTTGSNMHIYQSILQAKQQIKKKEEEILARQRTATAIAPAK